MGESVCEMFLVQWCTMCNVKGHCWTFGITLVAGGMDCTLYHHHRCRWNYFLCSYNLISTKVRLDRSLSHLVNTWSEGCSLQNSLPTSCRCSTIPIAYESSLTLTSFSDFSPSIFIISANSFFFHFQLNRGCCIYSPRSAKLISCLVAGSFPLLFLVVVVSAFSVLGSYLILIVLSGLLSQVLCCG